MADSRQFLSAYRNVAIILFVLDYWPLLRRSAAVARLDIIPRQAAERTAYYRRYVLQINI